ncbi:DUF2249 domain-containing protein [Chitinophaga defluvii]|uniref:DUF2249 domain-containing protein n=1 Tax=Chitinophaga defluvii TaxID=3163343 RepID=A0ABV2T3E5_9BACT
MIVTASSKIGHIIKENPAAITAIASVNKHFEKLRNPVLRKLLANRVTVAEAARIGNCDIAVLFEKLTDIGFVCEHITAPVAAAVLPAADINTERSASSPAIGVSPSAISTADLLLSAAIADADKAQAVLLDVRADLAAGTDPFKKIMQCVNGMLPGQTLCLVNSFVPLPLIKILEKKSFTCKVEQITTEEVHTFFKKMNDTAVVARPTAGITIDDTSFEQLLQQYEGHMVVVDVRLLEMPLPMVTILESLVTLAPHQLLMVEHRKVPLLLFPELQLRGYKYVQRSIGQQHVQLLIYKAHLEIHASSQTI